MLVEYNDTIYQIPIRYIEGEHVVLLTDVQSLIPNTTALLTNLKLLPFKLDSNHTAVVPKRVVVNDLDLAQSTVWQAHVPETYSNTLQTTVIEMQIKMDQLCDKLDRFVSSFSSSGHNLPESLDESNSQRMSLSDGSGEEHAHIGALPLLLPVLTSSQEEAINRTVQSDSSDASSRSSSPPPAFSMPSSSNQRHTQRIVPVTDTEGRSQHEAPPSYETSVLSTIKSLNDKLRVYESHISNRHKSPKWLSKREEWLSREPNSIDQIAYQLVQLEMALLWTAVSETWIQERETWLTLVASSQSERHLAGAIINLERHTLVMDEEWASVRERWVNELLEMVVLPLSHG
ncbi:hypothetical protein EDC96DRAFT_440929 [Choanephora cucurbitarum]|nr:hypothetical protein EDC96DRAFT_440929 [Choanephora cucurbitarum]